MSKFCQICGEEIEEDSKKLSCETCLKERAQVYYAHRELRFEMWQYIKHHPPMVVLEMFKAMVDEEGEDWVSAALGDALVDEIRMLEKRSKNI